MINKQNLWFLTLFSLILVLSVYYITMPNDLLMTNNSDYINEEDGSDDETKVTISDSEVLVAMRVDLEEERNLLLSGLQSKLTDETVSIDDKNNAYEQIKLIEQVKAKESNLETLIKETYNLESFIEVDNNKITVVVVSSEHNVELANNIMRTIQSEYEDRMYITVKFEE